MEERKGKQLISEQLQTALASQLKEEVDKSQKNIVGLQESRKKLQEKERSLYDRQDKILEPIMKERYELEQSIKNLESALIAEEKAYSKFMAQKFVLEKASVSISEEEIRQLDMLSRIYRAFDLKDGLESDKGTKSETCMWSACWTCTDVCGGCTGCSGICSYSCTAVFADTLNPNKPK